MKLSPVSALTVAIDKGKYPIRNCTLVAKGWTRIFYFLFIFYIEEIIVLEES